MGASPNMGMGMQIGDSMAGMMEYGTNMEMNDMIPSPAGQQMSFFTDDAPYGGDDLNRDN